VDTVRRCLALCIFAYGNRESSLMTGPSKEPKMGARSESESVAT
jgi:hypothetical protein